jgi:hypothetical protein
MNGLITVIHDWSRIVAGYFACLAPFATRIVVGWVLRWSGWPKLQSAAHRAATVGSEWDKRASAASVTNSQCRPKSLRESKGSRTCAPRRRDCSHMNASQWCNG